MPVILGPLLVETNVFFIMHCLWYVSSSDLVWSGSGHSLVQFQDASALWC